LISENSLLAKVYQDRHWKTTSLSGYKFERDGAQLLDARILSHNMKIGYDKIRMRMPIQGKTLVVWK
jgi:hypothetical protein